MNPFAIRGAPWLLGAALSAPFILLGFYVVPQADDFARGEIALREGVFAELKHHYALTDGRFAATALQTLCGLDLERAVAAGPFVFLALWGLSFWRCLFVVSSALWPQWPATRGRRLLSTAALAFFLLGFYLSRMPSPSQGFYWLNSAQTYTIACIVNWLFVAELIRLLDPQTVGWRRLTRHSLTATMLIVAMIGFNEIAMFLWDMALVLLMAALAFKRWRAAWLAPVLLGAALASAVVISSPSNATRAQRYPGSKRVPSSVARAAVHTAVKVGIWSLDPGLWLGVLLLIPAIRRWPDSPRLGWLRHRHAAPAIVAATAAAMSLAAFPAYYGMGHAPPPRACNMLYLIYAVGVFVAVASTALARPEWSPMRLRPWLVAASLFVFGNWPRAVWDGSTSAPQYRREYLARSQTVREALARGERQVEVEPLHFQPKTIFYADLQADPSYWVNIMYARRLRLDAVSFRDSSDGDVRRR
jgi:hypothetical protein